MNNGNRAAAIRLGGAVVAEQHDEGAVARRAMRSEALTTARLRVINGDTLEEALAQRDPAM